MGTSRYVYNQSITKLEHGTRNNWMEIKKDYLPTLPDWAKEVPYQIKGIAIRDACKDVSNARKKSKETHKQHKVHFRCKKNRRESIFIPKSAVIKQSIYPKILGEMKTFREKIPRAEHDCRLIYEYGKYFLCVPVCCPRQKPEKQRQTIVALDPGVRTFQTYFSIHSTGKFAHQDFSRIFRLCYTLDCTISKMAKSRARQRYRLKKVCDRIRFKIRNLVDEVQHKTALWLCREYQFIALPTFETSIMVKKLSHKTSRAMLTWAHFRFKQFLKFKAKELCCNVIDMNESYTSKTCSRCGTIANIGSKTIFHCKSCGLIMDRDIHGARNIFLRALVDTPSFSSR